MHSLTIIEPRKMAGYSVAKANEFIWNSMYSLSLMEQRIIACAISMLDSRAEAEIDSMWVEIDADAFCELFNISKRSSVSYIMSLLKPLSDKSSWIKLDNGHIKLFRWISDIDVDPHSKIFRIEIGRDLKQYLLNLDKNFTSYKLEMITSFQSKYSNIIFDLIYSHWRREGFSVGGGKRKYPAGEFQILLEDLKDKILYKWVREGKELVMKRFDLSFKDFRVKVIEPAISEINQFTDMSVSVYYIKKGKKYEIIQFIYAPK